MDTLSAILFFILFAAVFGVTLKDTNVIYAGFAAIGAFCFLAAFGSTDVFLRIMMIILGLGFLAGSVAMMKTLN